MIFSLGGEHYANMHAMSKTGYSRGYNLPRTVGINLSQEGVPQADINWDCTWSQRDFPEIRDYCVEHRRDFSVSVQGLHLSRTSEEVV